MLDYHALSGYLSARGMGQWADTLQIQLKNYFEDIRHGDYPTWKQAINSLPNIQPSSIDLTASTVRFGEPTDCDDGNRQLLKECLQKLMPWRKGPFNWFGVIVDTEWRSDIKWQRLQGMISPLSDRLVLDVGCGNGYYGWRMLGEGAKCVIGLDPTLRFAMQFQAAKRYAGDQAFYFLPFAIQDLPVSGLHFDSIFSMGVIYHRRDPLGHCRHLFDCLVSGGELILESLIIDDGFGEVLKPKQRYAKMRNVWAIPSVKTMCGWLVEAGFSDIRTADISQTTTAEQRKTAWMQFESLSDFLDPDDHSKTIEGYPAPKRAIIVAQKP